MFSKLKKMYKEIKIPSMPNQAKSAEVTPVDIPEAASEVKKKLGEIFAQCSDFHMREILLGETKVKITVAFMDNLSHKQTLNESLIKPIMDHQEGMAARFQDNKQNILKVLKTDIINSPQLSEVQNWNESIKAILSGDSAVYIEGSRKALLVGTRGWESRAVQEPQTETVVRGPREGFVENLGVNCALIRRKIKNPNLKMEIMSIGNQTHTDICICYLQGIVNEEILNALKAKLQGIQIDSVLESGYVEEYIEESTLSLFPTVGNSEKPDIVAAKILEGRVAILCDGTPFVLTVPYLFIESLQVSEDYYTRSVSSSLMRLLRVIAFYISVLLPALYVAFLTFHQAVLPLPLLITVTASREGIPFSPLTEAVFMGLVFEILQEAGVRMPRPIGQSVSIVGALVIGEASVRAGLVSDPMIIITAITAISTFILPPLQKVLPYFRVFFLLVANVMGLLGIFLMLIVMVTYMCSMHSFGIPYLSPLAPVSLLDLKDTLIRFPHWLIRRRPENLKGKKQRQQEQQ